MNTRMASSAIATVLSLLTSILLLSPELLAGGRRRVVAVSPPPSAPQLMLVGMATVIDGGAMAWNGGSRRSAISTRTLIMRIGEPGRESRGNATLSASIGTVDARFTIRLDGVPLTTAPRVIRRNAPIGIPFSHRLEIEVPVTASEGPIHTQIAWQITTE
jgi:hypothetical protein